MKLTWTQFSGIRPKLDQRLLPDGNAQVANNINTERGGLRPLEGLLDVMALSKSGVQSIYRFGLATDSETTYWFHWTTDVDVVKGPIADDTAERTYWTGDGVPKYTTVALGTGGSNLPSGSRPLGIPPPANAPILSASGTATEGGGAETRVYIYTFVTDNGEESAPSSPATVNIISGNGVLVSGMDTAAANGAVLANKRIYRAQRGVYLFVAEVSSGTSSYDDVVPSDTLAEPCPSVDWDEPSPTMFALTGGSNGMMAALDGYTVRMAEPFRPHAWPMSYSQTVMYPGVGLGHFGQSFVILTTGLPYILTGAHPANVSLSPAKFYQPCVSKRSIVNAGGDVIWASPDGLVAIGNGGEQNLTADLFTPDQWRTLLPETMIGAWHEGWYVGSYNPGTGIVGFMFRPATQEWVDLPEMAATAFYRDTVGDALFVCVADRITKFRSGAPLPYTWKSQAVVSHLTDFVAARVTGDYPTTFRLYKGGTLKMTKTVTSDEPFKLPAGLARQWEVEVADGTVLGIALATSEGEL